MPLKVLLFVLGRLMVAASKRIPAFRRQCSHAVVLQIATDDGVAYHFVFGRRSLVAGPGPVANPDLTLTFESAGLGFSSLSSPRAVHRIVQAMLAGRARVDGNPALLLWFFGLTRIVVPLGRQRPLREPLPDGFTAPDPDSSVAARITRLAPQARLDPAWADALAQHKKMAMPRASAGEPVPMW